MSEPGTAGPTEPSHGCLLCGLELVYDVAATPAVCATCGAEQPSPVRCRDGHFVCDACHAGSAKDVIERACRAATGRDPVALATRLMRHPAVKMHGPEHHFLVPATLLTAWSIATGGADRAALLAEARRRSDTVVGGSCGFHGACGSGIGVGIFASLATGATPRSGASWGQANRATGRTLQRRRRPAVLQANDVARAARRHPLRARRARRRPRRARPALRVPREERGLPRADLSVLPQRDRLLTTRRDAGATSPSERTSDAKTPPQHSRACQSHVALYESA